MSSIIATTTITETTSAHVSIVSDSAQSIPESKTRRIFSHNFCLISSRKKQALIIRLSATELHSCNSRAKICFRDQPLPLGASPSSLPTSTLTTRDEANSSLGQGPYTHNLHPRCQSQPATSRSRRSPSSSAICCLGLGSTCESTTIHSNQSNYQRPNSFILMRWQVRGYYSWSAVGGHEDHHGSQQR